MAGSPDRSTDEDIANPTVYVRLLDEGTEVCRPTQALDIGNGMFKVLPTPEYDPEHEQWEFPPGSIVRCEKRKDSSGEYFLAVAPDAETGARKLEKA
jgi:hypothetical protein